MAFMNEANNILLLFPLKCRSPSFHKSGIRKNIGIAVLNQAIVPGVILDICLINKPLFPAIKAHKITAYTAFLIIVKFRLPYIPNEPFIKHRVLLNPATF